MYSWLGNTLWIFYIFANQILEITLIIVRFVCCRLMQTYSKIHKFLDLLSYFSTRDWTMLNDNVTKMWYCLSEHDKQMFKFNIHDLDWTTYFKNYVWGIRLYIIKERNDTISAGLKKRKMWVYFKYHHNFRQNVFLRSTTYVKLLLLFIAGWSWFFGPWSLRLHFYLHIFASLLVEEFSSDDVNSNFFLCDDYIFL